MTKPKQGNAMAQATVSMEMLIVMPDAEEYVTGMLRKQAAELCESLGTSRTRYVPASERVISYDDGIYGVKRYALKFRTVREWLKRG